MARLAQIVIPGLPRHVTQRGNRREAIFFEDGDHETYLDLLAEQARKGRICAVHDKTSGVAQPNTEYVYNADGTRVAKGYLSSWPGIGSACPAPASGNLTLTRQYLLDSGADQVTELNGSGAWQHSNAFQSGRLTATYDTAGLHYSIADPLGTKRVQFSLTTSGSAQLDEKCKSLPFGNDLGNPRQASCSGTVADATEHHFTGKERDTECGNDYFGARYYASSMGRFMSPDWSAKIAPVPYAKLDDPQSLNLYAYVRNNPLGSVDADGHETETYLGVPGYEAQQENNKGISPTEWKIWGGVGLTVATLSGASEIAGGARALWGMGARTATAAYLALSVLGTQTAQNFMSARDNVSNSLGAIRDAAASGEISLSGPTAGRLSSAMNAVSNSFTNSDINGAIKQSVTGIEAGGDHVQELQGTGNSLANLSKSLSGALQNPNLSDNARSLYTNAINAIKPAVDQINKLKH